MRAIIVHGTGGSPQDNWFPWLRSELEQRGAVVFSPRFPTPEGQSCFAWQKALLQSVGELQSSDILIGHSIGAAFVCRVLERSTVKIRAAVMVAGFARQLGSPDFDPFNRTFLEQPFDWSTIRNNAEHFISFSGDNDPYVPLPFGKELAGALCVPMLVIPNGGHINTASGFKTFPQLIESMKELIPK